MRRNIVPLTNCVVPGARRRAGRRSRSLLAAWCAVTADPPPMGDEYDELADQFLADQRLVDAL